ncbi:MAG: glycolate oxidase subunit GlcE [Gammaproteobacteria bacterium]|nr:glycolate oxidase subunit GlcE [Gammaproteobacteria bacterium]MCY4219765.1 glycolate oxidase subunit GlcE [Gammaproteobacteria bacterium]MCY4275350.1 glycolate oxidase subunit GlcE [Gammaproteobacteria bacterium]
MQETDYSALKAELYSARQTKQPLAIEGGGTRKFYGREIVGKSLSLSDYQGIVEYNPTELVVTVKAGTTIDSLSETLHSNQQMLGFEPPNCLPESTVGGTLALGLSGSTRPYRGNVQDFVLGVRLLTGDGRNMRFGGQVIKNVAGFDVSRLVVGSLGCLGIVLEVSFKVIPKPECEWTLNKEIPDVDQAILEFNALSGKPYPITAAAWCNKLAHIRLSGSEAGVKSAAQIIGGSINENDPIWEQINTHSHPFFKQGQKIIKVFQKPSASVIASHKPVLVDWGGALRWYREEVDETELQLGLKEQGGWLERFCGADRTQEVFSPLHPATMRIKQRLKDVFDPDRILNPGRMYSEL